MRFVHLTLPDILRELGPCTMPRNDLAALREVVLPKLRHRSVVLPAQPRYQLSASMNAIGGWMFVLQARHGSSAVVARIGIGWRDHGASQVWRECVGDHNEEPSRPWVVDELDPTSLNGHDVDRLVRWVPLLARDLAWALVPPWHAWSASLGSDDRCQPPATELGNPTRLHLSDHVAGQHRKLQAPARRCSLTLLPESPPR